MLDPKRISLTTPRISVDLREYYKQQNYFEKTSLPAYSPIISKENYILPVITIKNSPLIGIPKIHREVSISMAASNAHNANEEAIDPFSIFSQASAAQHVLFSSSSSMDNNLFIQHLLYRWASRELWPNFDYVFRIDLKHLLSLQAQSHNSPLNGMSYDSIAKLIKYTLNLQSISQKQIHDLIARNPQKLLILLEGYEDIKSLETEKIKQFLSLFSNHNVIITSKENSVYREDGSLSSELHGFHIHMELINKGISPSSVHQQLRLIFKDQTHIYSEFVKFIGMDDDLMEMSKNPSILQMLNHIWQELPSKTITQLYNKLYLMANELEDIYKTEILSKPSLILFSEALNLKTSLLTQINHQLIVKISKLPETPDGVKTLKFLAGLLAIHNNSSERENGLKTLFDIIISSNPAELKIGGENTISLIMHFIKEANSNAHFLNQDIFDYIDQIILSDVHKWSSAIISSSYYSTSLVKKLQEMLEGDIRNDILVALKVFSTMNLELIPQKRVLVMNFQAKLLDHDLAIAEAASNALKSAMLLGGEEYLIETLEDSKVHINSKIAIIDALKISNENKVLDKILSLLNRNTDYWVHSAILSSLKDIYILSHSSKREIIINSLFKQLAKDISEQPSFFKSTLSLLKDLKYETSDMLSKFSKELKECQDDHRLEVIVNTIKNLLTDLFPPETKKDTARILLEKLDMFRSIKISDLFYNEKHYLVRAKMKEVLGTLFPFCEQDIKARIYSTVSADIASRDNLLSSNSIKVLETIYEYNPEGILTNLIANLNAAKSMKGKIATIESLTNIFHSLSVQKQNQVAEKLFNIVLASSDQGILAAGYKFLQKLSFSNFNADLEQIALKAKNTLETTRELYILENSAELLANLFSNLPPKAKNAIFTLLKFKITNPNMPGEQSYVVKMLAQIYSSLTSSQKREVVGIFKNLYDNLALVESKEILELAISKIQDSPEAKSVGLSYPNTNVMHTPALYDDSKLIADLTDALIQKYLSSSITINIEDQLTINHLFEKILTITLDTENPIIFQRMVSLLKKAEYAIPQVIDVLNQYSNSKEKIEKVKKLPSIFDNNPDLIQAAEGLILALENSLVKLFPNIDFIINNLEYFVEYVLENNVEIKITKDSITFNGKIYLHASEVKDTLKFLDYARIIFNAFSTSSNKLIKTHSITSTGIFETADQLELAEDTVKLTILRQVNVVGSTISDPTNMFLVIEHRTVFGDILTTKISINNKFVSKVTLSNLDKNYKVLLLGKHSEHIDYFVKSVLITKKELSDILHLSNSWTSKKQLLEHTLEFLSSSHPEIKDNGVLISHNSLIDYSELEERMSHLEDKFDFLETKLTEELQSLKLDQDSSKKIIEQITSHLKAIGQISLPHNLTPFKQHLALEIIHGLNSLHMAAMVVQTSMVSNSQTGILGASASILEKISSSIPIAGIAVEFFSLILSTLDGRMQDILSQKIASLAIDSVEMAQLSRALALKIVNSDISIENLEALKNSIPLKLNALATNLDTNLLKVLIDKVEDSLTMPNETTKATSYAKYIVNLLISYIITKDINLSITYKDNYNLLEHFLIENQIIIEQPPLILSSQSVTATGELTLDMTAGDNAAHSALYPITNLKRESSTTSSCSLGPRERKGSDFSDEFKRLRDDYDEEYQGTTDYKGKPLLLESRASEDANPPDLKGALIVNIAETLPSARYLLSEYIPVIPYFKNWEIIKTLSPYEHIFDSLVHVSGNIYNAIVNPQEWKLSLLSSTSFVSRPYVYQFRDKLLTYLKGNEHEEIIKLSAYIATDAGLSFIENIVFYGFTPVAFYYALTKGLSSGTISYYNSRENKEYSVVSDVITKSLTTATLYGCYKYIEKIDNLEEKLLAIPLICIPAATSTHYYSKYYADTSLELITNFAGAGRTNETLIDQDYN